MDISELQDLARHARSTREAGFALLFASGILACFLYLPIPSTVPAVSTTATSTRPNAFAHVPLEAHAALVFDLATQKPLFEKNADVQLPLASLTKLLTVYTALSALASSTPITITKDVTTLEQPRLFAPGVTLSLGDLARLTLTASLNDGAAAILATVASTRHVDQTQLLAGAAAALNLTQTYAVNGSGLDVSAVVSGGYGSARDLATLAGALITIAPDITAATTQPSARAVSSDGKTYSVSNTDPIVSTVPHILLSKTGYTDLANGNLVLVFDVGMNHPIAIVILGSSKQARFTDGSALVAATLAHFAGVATL